MAKYYRDVVRIIVFMVFTIVLEAGYSSQSWYQPEESAGVW